MSGPRLQYWQARANGLDAHESRFVKVIEDHDCQVTLVFDEEGGEPDFAYSTGLYDRFGHPELFVIGLQRDLMHAMINGARDEIRDGATFEDGKFYRGILEGFDCFLCTVPKEHYREYFGWSLWYYGGDGFPARQVVWPTTKNSWPWMPSYPDNLRNVQPLLGMAPAVR